ncbi:MAG: response regulator, partial [Candidatus Cloacimonetes bacterium]|nr:response regulator [Candidatus Cloacimonadota bacterium]
WAEAENRNYSLIEISDTGMGIPENVQQTIFEAFFTTKEKGKGTGLGLSTSKSIIESYKGYMTFTSKVGEGTTFKILLPWVKQEVTVSSKKIETAITKTHKILLVDDEEIVLEIGVALLEELGNQVFSTNNGINGLEILQAHPEITLAIIDRIMPKMDGLHLLKKIKALRPNLPVIIASGLLQESMVRDFIENGAADCITKPFRLEHLKRLLDN